MSEPGSLQFVDTNVLIYAHDVSAGQKQSRAKKLMRDPWQSGEGCLSIQVLHEF
jgi:predicted nucleic acid-binding protein